MFYSKFVKILFGRIPGVTHLYVRARFPYNRRGEQKREEGEMAQKKLGGGRNRGGK